MIWMLFSLFHPQRAVVELGSDGQARQLTKNRLFLGDKTDYVITSLSVLPLSQFVHGLTAATSSTRTRSFRMNPRTPFHS